MQFGCKKLPHKYFQPYIFLDSAVISHKDTMLEMSSIHSLMKFRKFLYVNHFCGQVVPGIPPPYSLSDFSPDLH